MNRILVACLCLFASAAAVSADASRSDATPAASRPAQGRAAPLPQQHERTDKLEWERVNEQVRKQAVRRTQPRLPAEVVSPQRRPKDAG